MVEARGSAFQPRDAERREDEGFRTSLFLRLLEDDDKGAALLHAVRSVAAGEPDRRVLEVAPASFEQVPGRRLRIGLKVRF